MLRICLSGCYLTTFTPNTTCLAETFYSWPFWGLQHCQSPSHHWSNVECLTSFPCKGKKLGRFQINSWAIFLLLFFPFWSSCLICKTRHILWPTDLWHQRSTGGLRGVLFGARSTTRPQNPSSAQHCAQSTFLHHSQAKTTAQSHFLVLLYRNVTLHLPEFLTSLVQMWNVWPFSLGKERNWGDFRSIAGLFFFPFWSFKQC